MTLLRVLILMLGAWIGGVVVDRGYLPSGVCSTGPRWLLLMVAVVLALGLAVLLVRDVRAGRLRRW